MRSVKRWFVVMEWEDGAVDELYPSDLPDCVSSEMETYKKECEDFINQEWELDYEIGHV